MGAYQPQPQTETDSDLQTLPKMSEEKNRVVDVSKLYSKDAYAILVRAGKLAFSLKDFYLTPLHVFLAFLDDPLAKNYNLGNILDIKKATLEKIKSLPQPTFKNLVFLEPKLKESLITAYIVAKRNNQTKIEKQQLFLGILNNDLLKEVNSKFNIDPAKFEQNAKKTVSMGSYVSQNLPFIQDLSSTFSGTQDFNLIGRENELS